jgi:hypothetical protein
MNSGVPRSQATPQVSEERVTLVERGSRARREFHWR